MSAETLRRAAATLRADSQTTAGGEPCEPDEFGLAVAAWLDDIATRHSASTDTVELVLHYDADEVCETCEDGGGHESIVCEGCFPTWEGMDGYCTYPCRETKAALAVANAYLGATP